MFGKPYKLKSNNTLKNSEKKQLVQKIISEFPSASEEKAKVLVPNKSNATYMKVNTHNNIDLIGVYAVDGYPVMIDLQGRLVPTMHALWQVPDLVPTLIIHAPVLSKLQGGSPLYLPGVVIPASGSGMRLPRFSSGVQAAICTEDNRAACGVGFTVMSSDNMSLMSGGMCFELVHTIGDYLYKDIKFTKQERPHMGVPSYEKVEEALTAFDRLTLQSASISTREEWPSLSRESNQSRFTAPDETTPLEKVHPHPHTSLTEKISEEESKFTPVPDDMDGLLRYTLLTFMKLRAKNIELPLATNLLYRKHLVPMCPLDRTLDIKQSSYKKLSKFLEEMQKEGLLETREVSRGVAAVTLLQVSHNAVRSHRPAPPPPLSDASPSLAAPALLTKYAVTAAVAPLMPNYKKGSIISASEVRSAIKHYVNDKKLQSGSCVAVDAALGKITQTPPETEVRWDTLMSSVVGKMTECTEVRHGDGTHKLVKSKLAPVTMQVHTRSGNKKVTLVSNLETFGFSLVELVRECQIGSAGSCGVTRAPGAKSDQLMLQGDQTYFITKLLMEKYGLPKNLIEGADKALNKKK